jgi:5-formyltetrahydrofolate cyclo-ligase
MPRTITARFPHHRQWCMIASVADSKSDLRARIRAARLEVASAAARAQEPAGLLAAARAAGLLDPDGNPDSIGAVAIAAYIAAPGEPDVAAIRAAVRQAGGVVLLPIPRADRTMDWARDDGDYRPEGRYPIEVPAGDVVGSGATGLLAHGVRTILVPALAVDETGARLGQGGGYYDRLLSELVSPAGRARAGGGQGAAHPSAVDLRVVAVVRDVELLPAGDVPREAHDQLMTAALTPTRFVHLDR